MELDEKTKGIAIESNFVDINEVKFSGNGIIFIDNFRFIKTNPESAEEKPKKPYFRMNERY